MNTRDLQYLIALADHRHFGKAAAACFVSQPALSMQIKKLEETLGVKLLERSNKSVLLTDIGMIIAEQARKIVNQLNELREMAKIAHDPLAGDIHLGIIPTLAAYLLPSIMPTLIKTFPRLSFYLIEEQTASLIKRLEQGKLDAAFLVSPIAHSSLTDIPLFKEEFLLTVPHTHVHAKRKLIKSSDLFNESLLLLEEGHCLREQALQFCQQVRAQEAAHFRATSLETLRHMVAANIGMTLMPKLACIPHPQLHYIPFAQTKPDRNISLYLRQSSAKQIALKAIGQQIKKILAKKNLVTIIK